jgi:hypothetical protein
MREPLLPCSLILAWVLFSVRLRSKATFLAVEAAAAAAHWVELLGQHASNAAVLALQQQK